MERSLFAFIWKYSKREQMVLLAMTVVTFPLLYASLELPKRVINDAIGAEPGPVQVWIFELTQIQFLLALSFGYLFTVLAHGLMKMRLNTMKGIVAERMLRRFRYGLIARMMRFPKRYFQTTSQGELVSMISAEAEPMGGVMGDAIAHPVFQAGQMLIIVVFLFLQSVWFGLAGVALIPLQAYVIPILQRRINLMNKERIIEVRALSSEIGEAAQGMTDLRLNGGWRYRRALFSNRLGRLFQIRYRIYNAKFFMKFLNNFITQLTPFFFYSVGGVLAIQGQITVGALVAALAAYKDLSSPWKELLNYYNRVQDMSLRWDIVTERFAPAGIIDETLFEGAPDQFAHLRGDIGIEHVTVRSEDGGPVLEDISLSIPAGARAAIKVPSQTERAALADLLTREVLPDQGVVRVGGADLNSLHQAVIAGRIGYAQSRPQFFEGTLGDNLMMSLRGHPPARQKGQRPSRAVIEAVRAGNSPDDPEGNWTDPALAEFGTEAEIRAWWFQLLSAMGTEDNVFREVLGMEIDPALHPELAQTVIDLRPEIHERLAKAGLDDTLHRFDPEGFNPALPLGSNLIFAAPKQFIDFDTLRKAGGFLRVMGSEGLSEEIIAMAQTVVENLHRTFGNDGTDHPLFRRLGIEPELYEQLTNIAQRRREQGDGAISAEEFSILTSVPLYFTAEQIGSALPDPFRETILDVRHRHGQALRTQMSGLFREIKPEEFMPRFTLTENLIFGRFSMTAGARADMARDIVAELLTEKGLRQLVAEAFWDIHLDRGGANVPNTLLERAAFSRAAIKRPDILILDMALASFNAADRKRTREELARILPDTTLIFLEPHFDNPQAYDVFAEITEGRISGDAAKTTERADEGSDFDRKLRAVGLCELFAGLSPRNQRLLAFAGTWHDAKAGSLVFRKGDAVDAVYLCVDGRAALQMVPETGEPRHVSTVEPGRLIGDLSVLLGTPRDMHLAALDRTRFLRIGADEFRSVVQTDPTVAYSLLRTVAGSLSDVAVFIRDSGIELPDNLEQALEDAEAERNSSQSADTTSD